MEAACDLRLRRTLDLDGPNLASREFQDQIDLGPGGGAVETRLCSARSCRNQRLYVFDPASAPKELKGLIGGKIRENTIVENWPDILRSAATMVAGHMPPSQLLRKFASFPRQHDLAVALRETGRIERTLFIFDWLLDVDMQRRAQIGLNKGEAHHALKNALRVGRQGEIRDRTTEAQHYRLAGLNLLAAIISFGTPISSGGQSFNDRKKD